LAMNSLFSITNFLKFFFNHDGYQSKFVDQKYQWHRDRFNSSIGMILDKFHCEFFKVYRAFLFAMDTSPNSMNKHFYHFEVIFYSSIGTGRVIFHF
jgi:hypothetical protein